MVVVEAKFSAGKYSNARNANEHLSLPGVIQFVARIGYVDEYPPANSVRRSVKEIIRYAE